VPLLIVPVLVVLAFVALIPIALVQRFRMGVARQRARGWLIAINLVGISISMMMFVYWIGVRSRLRLQQRTTRVQSTIRPRL
jgi:hypothetical protein